MDFEVAGPWPVGTPLKRKTFDLSEWGQRSWNKYKRKYGVNDNTVFLVAGYLKGGCNLWLIPRGQEVLIEGSIRSYYPINPQTSLEDWA